MGQCELANVPTCDGVREYIQGHGLQSSPRLSYFEVIDDFRVLTAPEEKTETQKLMDDLAEALR